MRCSCCAACGRPDVQIHHIFPGTANRRMSDRYGYTIPLCAEHHARIHRDREMALHWMRLAQMHFEGNYGTRQDFIKRFGRSWI